MNIDPESMMNGVNWTVQLIGLLSAWKQERKSIENDKYQNFMEWLHRHNFSALSEKIDQSTAISTELHSLLSLSHTQIDQKLDALASAVESLTIKIDGLGMIGRAVSEDSGTLPPQAREILKLFSDQKDCLGMIMASHDNDIIFIPANVIWTMDEPQFVPDDIQLLEEAEFINLKDHTPSGSPIYSLTRRGAQFAATLPSVEIPD